MSVFQVPPREGITEEEKQLLVNDIANAVVSAVAALIPTATTQEPITEETLTEPVVVEPVTEELVVEPTVVEPTVEEPTVEEPVATE